MTETTVPVPTSARLRLKLLEHFVSVDTDGDGQVDEVKVDILDVKVSCPT